MFFQEMNGLMASGIDLKMIIQKNGDKLVVSILPSSSVIKDDATKQIVPLVISGTPEELDSGFIGAISSPIQKATGLLSNISEFEKSADTAEKNSKKAEADKKKFDQLIKKADQLEKDKKMLNAVACLKQALEYAPNKKTVEDRIKKLEAQAGAGSIFGEMDTEESVQDDYLEADPKTSSDEDFEDTNNEGEEE